MTTPTTSAMTDRTRSALTLMAIFGVAAFCVGCMLHSATAGFVGVLLVSAAVLSVEAVRHFLRTQVLAPMATWLMGARRRISSSLPIAR